MGNPWHRRDAAARPRQLALAPLVAGFTRSSADAPMPPTTNPACQMYSFLP